MSELWLKDIPIFNFDGGSNKITSNKVNLLKVERVGNMNILKKILSKVQAPEKNIYNSIIVSKSLPQSEHCYFQLFKLNVTNYNLKLNYVQYIF